MYYLYAVSDTLTVPDPVPPQLPGLSGWVPVVLGASLLTAALRVGSLTPNA
jgi:hypothetical protein